MTINTASSTSTPTVTGSLSTIASIEYYITGSNAADTITTGAGADSVTGGVGADIISTGAGNDTVRGGTGFDIINVGSGTDQVQLLTAAGATGGDTLAYTAAANNTARSTVAIDQITGMGAGDTIKLLTAYTGAAGAAAGLIALATATSTMASNAGNTLIDNGISVVRGTFDATAATFVGAADGISSMVVYDADATVGTVAYEHIILVGYIGTITGGAAGVMTLG
jgi:Ca2+-binding RTX toxin-like protein